MKPPVYTRSECLVRTDVSAFDDSGEIDFSLFMMRAIVHLDLPTASVGFNGEHLESMYVLFTERCDQKFEMMQSIADTFKETYPEGGTLIVTKDRVEIGEDTIRHSGPEWIDGLPRREK